MDSIILSITFGAFSKDFSGSERKETVGAKWEQNGLRTTFHLILFIGDFDSGSSSAISRMGLRFVSDTRVHFLSIGNVDFDNSTKKSRSPH